MPDERVPELDANFSITINEPIILTPLTKMPPAMPRVCGAFAATCIIGAFAVMIRRMQGCLPSSNTEQHVLITYEAFEE